MLSQKFGYILKLVSFVDIPWIVMFLGYINAKLEVKISYSPLSTFFPVIFYQPLTFWSKMHPSLFLEE